MTRQLGSICASVCIGIAAVAVSVRLSAPDADALSAGPSAVQRDDQKSRYPAFEVGAIQPFAFTAEPALWVINQPGNRLVKLDPLTLAVQEQIPIGLGGASVFERPGTDELWITDRVQGCVTVVSRSRGAITHTIRVGAEPHSLCFSPSGDRAWVSCSAVDRVDVVSTATYSVVQSIAIPAREPRAIVHAAGKVWVASFLSGNGTAAAGTTADPLAAASIGPTQGPSTTALPDRDLFAIVPGALGADVLDRSVTKTRLGTTLFNMHVRPGTNELWIPNTEALNADHKGEKSFVGGRVVSNRITVVDAAGIAPTRVLDLDVIAPPGVRCAQPTGIAFDASGTRAYVCGYGSDIVAVLQIMQSGALYWRGHVNLPPRFGYPAGTAPRMCTLSPDGGTLYVLNRNDVSVARIAIASLPLSTPYAIDSPLPTSIGFEASSGEERLGRHLFTDGRNSKSLTSSCASCHVDGHTDGIVWDLSRYLDPEGTPPAQTQFGLDVKGPLVTQSTRRMEEVAPYHWRGEKLDLTEFNQTFITLLDREVNGVPAHVGADFQYLIHFINRLAWPANPLQKADRTLTSEEAAGASLFQTLPVLGGRTCADCHTLPLGTRGEVVAESAGGVLHSADVPSLRGVATKAGVPHAVGGAFGTRPELGAGLTHAGVHATIEDAILRPDHAFPGQPHFAITPLQAQQIAAFLRAFDTGLAPATAFQTTVRADNLTAARDELQYLRTQADAGNCDLVVMRTPPPGATTATFARTGVYVPELSSWRLADATLAPVDQAFLLSEAAAGSPVTFVGMPLGAGWSHGVDRDMDGLFDVDEARLGSGADRSDTDGDSFPDGYEIQLGANPLAYDVSIQGDTVAPQLVGQVRLVYATTNTLKIEFRTSEPCRVHMRLNGGPPVQRIPLDHQVDTEHWVILTDLSPGTAYTIGLEMRDPSNNIHTDTSASFSTLPTTFPDPVHVSAMQLAVASGNGPTTLRGSITLKAGGQPAAAQYEVHTAIYRQSPGGALTMVAPDLVGWTAANGIAAVRMALPAGSPPGSTWYAVVTRIDAPSGAPPYVLAYDVLRHTSVVH
jgi:DNA-binding beta-propeller fold protein YncE